MGTLEVDQIFLLFDRILVFESLDIIAILAAGIFVFRANLILNCTSQDEFDELFSDLSQIKVMPIIQHFLFATGINWDHSQPCYNYKLWLSLSDMPKYQN